MKYLLMATIVARNLGLIQYAQLDSIESKSKERYSVEDQEEEEHAHTDIFKRMVTAHTALQIKVTTILEMENAHIAVKIQMLIQKDIVNT